MTSDVGCGETQSLQSAIQYNDSMAVTCGQGAESTRQSIANCQAGRMKVGPALTEMACAADALTTAHGHYAAAADHLRGHAGVTDAYSANPEAGDKQFVAQGSAGSPAGGTAAAPGPQMRPRRGGKQTPLGPHEVLEPCGMIHRPGRSCNWCHDTGQVARCRVCATADCDGVHDYCLNCDGEGTVSCTVCGGDGVRIVNRKRVCGDCGGRGTPGVACGTCDGEGQVDDEDRVVCGDCESGSVPCPACGGKATRS